MIAWTRQHEAALRELEEKGVFRMKEGYIRQKNGPISEYYLALYDWYVRLAGRIVPRPEGVTYPIWLFLEEEDKLPPLEGTVVMKLDIPEELIVCTDSERWGYRVNYMYVPVDEADRRRHEEELERYGIANEPALIQTDKGNFYPLLKRKIINSWPRVFEKPGKGYKAVQGTVWELQLPWLQEVIL